MKRTTANFTKYQFLSHAPSVFAGGGWWVGGMNTPHCLYKYFKFNVVFLDALMLFLEIKMMWQILEDSKFQNVELINYRFLWLWIQNVLIQTIPDPCNKMITRSTHFVITQTTISYIDPDHLCMKSIVIFIIHIYKAS